ncbi:N-acetylglutamate synthase [Tothia fuscella]|uniref:Amino-acid acetyltransferase, mitochondrial n=1 Tax=Tothia fuscella TaxID=1048955 RepID=A0A9P4NWC7_9PEZI|nr:N-acetylglutamate synthase [Tothia fuscella]
MRAGRLNIRGTKAQLPRQRCGTDDNISVLAPSCKHNDLQREKMAERDFFFSVLSTTTTKREAKSYISRFKAPILNPDAKVMPKVQEAVSETVGKENYNTWCLNKSGVNLGGLYGATRATAESPVFTQQPLLNKFQSESVQPLHVALVKIRAPHLLEDTALGGVGLTLAQLARLELLSVVVVDCDEADIPEDPGQITQQWRRDIMEQCTRVARAIHEHSKAGARVVDQLLGVTSVQQAIPHRVHVRGGVEVRLGDLLKNALRDGVIPVIPPFAYTDTLHMQRIQPDDAVLALTRELAGLTPRTLEEEEPGEIVEGLTAPLSSMETPTSLDRVIILDPLGGLPTRENPDQSHIFVNLEQEYREVRDRFANGDGNKPEDIPTDQSKPKNSIFGASNPFTRLLETEIVPPTNTPQASDLQSFDSSKSSQANRYVNNLDLVQRCLTLLPPASSALLTTPAEAASSAFTSIQDNEATVTGVSTRPKRNPLIHNLLTDKPIISSSLPAARFSSPSLTSATISYTTPATFFKRGMPITIIPDPRNSPWTAPSQRTEPLRLESDPRIDFPRLLHLIEDSFGRKLNVQDYLSRIKDRIAGIIIAGEYEGGAILTWESPPSIPGSESGLRPLVPYLDKFAVLRRSQGSGGVADVVFNAMVRDCFPNGVVWRSRRDNPVNKWYFERSVGTWKVPNSQWTMFWTGGDVDWGTEGGGGNDEKKKRWRDFVGVCEGIQANWADTKPPD